MNQIKRFNTEFDIELGRGFYIASADIELEISFDSIGIPKVENIAVYPNTIKLTNEGKPVSIASGWDVAGLVNDISAEIGKNSLQYLEKYADYAEYLDVLETEYFDRMADLAENK